MTILFFRQEFAEERIPQDPELSTATSVTPTLERHKGPDFTPEASRRTQRSRQHQQRRVRGTTYTDSRVGLREKLRKEAAESRRKKRGPSNHPNTGCRADEQNKVGI